MTRPLVKICGVTRPEDARLAAELGAALIGLNFYPPSPRALDPDTDRPRLEEIVSATQESSPSPGLKRPASGPADRERSEPPQPAFAPADRERSELPLMVGVFVNEDPSRIGEIAELAALDLVQLHGDEGPEVVARFGRRAIKVFRRGSVPGPEELADYSEAWGLLFDVPTPSPGRSSDAEPYGGTGRSWNYEMLAAFGRTRFTGPVLVAGGIRPNNARRALGLSRADGVDVCSGVESAPGVKDPERMRRLFEEVRHGTP